MLQRLYQSTINLASRPRAKIALALVSFAESSFFPIPPDVMLIPMVLAERNKAFLIATIATISSVLGGIAGYLIGALAFESIGLPIIELYGGIEDFEKFRKWYGEWGLLIVFTAGLTPLPYKIFTIASGFASLNPIIFLAGSLVSRGIRFFTESILIWFYGEKIRIFIEKHLNFVAIIFVFFLVTGFILVKIIL